MLKMIFRKISKKSILIVCSVVLLLSLSIFSLYRLFAVQVNPASYNASSVIGETVYVNDLVSDWNYYQARNFTYFNNDTIPSGDNQGLFTTSNLIPVTVIYDSTDMVDNTLVGRVSHESGENQTKYVYYKYYHVVNGKIEIELPDNLWSWRPTGKGFSGWSTDYSGVDLYFDKAYYTRKAIVQVSGTEPIEITFHAIWNTANYLYATAGDTDVFEDYSMKRYPTERRLGTWAETVPGVTYDYDLDPNKTYYTVDPITRLPYTEVYSGTVYNTYIVSDNANLRVRWVDSRNCTQNVPCRPLIESHDTNIQPNTPYYVLHPDTDPNSRFLLLEMAQPQDYAPYVGYKYFPDHTKLAGYFYKKDIGGEERSRFVDDAGTSCTVSNRCTNGNTYKYLGTTDPQADYNTSYEPGDYYYLVTRDINILVLSGDSTSSDLRDFDYPFTITSLDTRVGGSINAGFKEISISNRFYMGNDTTIENVHIKMNRYSYYETNEDIGSNAYGNSLNTNARIIVANAHNFKLGRNVTNIDGDSSDRGYLIADNFFGGENNNSVSSGGERGTLDNPVKYKVILESGRFRNVIMGPTCNYTYRVNARAVYGSDYDRVKGNNTNFIAFVRIISKYWGRFESIDAVHPSLSTVFKSGSVGVDRLGNYSDDSSYALYIGAIGSGYYSSDDKSLKEAKIEGGNINVVNGGPLVDSSRTNVNSIFIAMTGGTVRSIFGGAATTQTYGNRIIQVTGGTVKNNIFGGSNAYNGSSGNGIIAGHTLVYVGGNTVVGDSDTILFSGGNGPSVGDVFGAGNGGSTSSNMGIVNNSMVIINGSTGAYGNMTIHGSVYGGGNFGSAGRNANNTDTNTKIHLLNGTIDGSVYGGGNNVGAGNAVTSTQTGTPKVVGDYYTGVNYVRTSRNGGPGTIPANTYNTSGVFNTTTTSCTANYPGAIYDGSRYRCYYATTFIPSGTNYNANTYYYKLENNEFVRENNPPVTGVTVTSSGNLRHSVYIKLDGASVGDAIYGGSNVNGSINGPVTIDLISNSSTTPSVYGGGKGGDTEVLGNIAVNTNASTNSALNLDEVYGGSAYGKVNTVNTGSTTHVTINGGIINEVYGGSEGDADNIPQNDGLITVDINSGDIGEVYGGNNLNGVPSKKITVNLNGGTIDDAYGGGNATAITQSVINLKGSAVSGGVYGGSNESGDNAATEVHIESGSATNVYGGNNKGGTVTETAVYYEGALVSEAVYGCGNGSEGDTSCDTTNVFINNTTKRMNSVFGGGKKASVTDEANVLMLQGIINNIYGGSDAAGTVEETNVYVSGGTIDNVFGGNNAGGETVTSNVNIGGGNIASVYGGGSKAPTTTTHVKHYSGYSQAVYGGGYKEGVSDATYVNIYGGTVTKTFGGSNNDGYVKETHVNIASEADSEVYDDEEEYTGDDHVIINRNVKVHFTLNNETEINHDPDCWFKDNNGHQNPDFCNYNIGAQMTISIQNDMDVDLTEYKVYFEGNNAYPAPTDSGQNWFRHKIKYDEYRDKYYFDEEYTTEAQGWYHTTNQIIPAHTTVQFDDPNGLWILSDDDSVQSMTSSLKTYSDAGEEQVSYDYPQYEATTMRVRDVYGGNNDGGLSEDTHVVATNGYATFIYGGSQGAAASAGTTDVSVTGGQVTNVYGGGDKAQTTGDTEVKINNGSITNLFGGGKGASATVGGDNTVIINGGTVENNVYGGGDQAATLGNTLVTVIKGTINSNIFGAGNHATTGVEANNASDSTVIVLSGNIGGSVYGGASFSKVFGTTHVYVGEHAIAGMNEYSSFLGNQYDHLKNIHIEGTIFGGGDANDLQSETYDYNFISVTVGTTLLIDATGYDFDKYVLIGSFFGSGNASEIAQDGYSRLTIINYGDPNKPASNVSIQRARLVKIYNSNIEFEGAKDKANEHSNVEFTLSRIDQLYLLDNTSLYLRSGANLLKNFYSGTYNNNNVFVKEKVVIEDGVVLPNRNVNNKVFMYPGKVLNIANDPNVTDPGTVNGMTFLGMYKPNPDGTVITGMYKEGYLTGDEALASDISMVSGGTYVYGKHIPNHDLTVDGYYSHYVDDNNIIEIKYVDTTPPSADYYFWMIGVNVFEFEVNMVASKYSTLGAVELQLRQFEDPNTKFILTDYNYEGLDDDINFIKKADIPKVAANENDANNNYALEMATSNTGWASNSRTMYYTDDEDSVDGDEIYIAENTNLTPSLLFYLYHSKNISEQGKIGSVNISMNAIVPIDVLTNEIKRISITVNIERAVYDEIGYDASITAGKQYDIFPTTTVNITNKSSLSAFFTMFIEPENHQTPYKANYHRALTTNTVFPVGTTITMLDRIENEYYYYTVNETNIVAKQSEMDVDRQVSYFLSDFIKMDSTSTNNTYNDAYENGRYYHAQDNWSDEEFIFIVDFGNTNITENIIDSKLELEIRNADNQTIIPILGELHDVMKFNVYAGTAANLTTTGNLSDNNIYVGEETNIHLDTVYSAGTIEGTNKTISDTVYYDYKLGAKISVLDNEGHQLDISSLLGVTFQLGGMTYYPQKDGTTRINLAGRVSNVSSDIVMNTANSNLSNGEYTIKVETFGSYDGLYYGETPTTLLLLPITILNNRYGIDIERTDLYVTRDKTTGLDAENGDEIVYNLTTSSGLDNPNLRVSLLRRRYGDGNEYSLQYDLVDLKDYVTDDFVLANSERLEYQVTDDLPAEIEFKMHMKENLVTGTYKVLFTVCDGDTPIGSVYEFIIIR